MDQAGSPFPHIILASGSPRRRLIFEMLGIPHTPAQCDVDERAITAASPREFALKAAFAKAGALDDEVPEGGIIVAADTIVVLDGEIFFKPIDAADAARMLKALSGRIHKVITAVAVREARRTTQLDAVATDVKIKPLSDEEISDYIATGEPMDKAGSYGIQGLGGKLVEEISGDYFNVVGLPVDKLLDMLDAHMDTMKFRTARVGLTREQFAGK